MDSAAEFTSYFIVKINCKIFPKLFRLLDNGIFCPY